MLLPRKALFLIVDDEPGAVRRRDLDQRDAGVVGAGRGDACEIDRFTPGDPAANVIEARARKTAVEAVKSAQPQQMRTQPAGGVKACAAQPRMAGTSSGISQSATPETGNDVRVPQRTRFARGDKAVTGGENPCLRVNWI